MAPETFQANVEATRDRLLWARPSWLLELAKHKDPNEADIKAKLAEIKGDSWGAEWSRAKALGTLQAVRAVAAEGQA